MSEVNQDVEGRFTWMLGLDSRLSMLEFSVVRVFVSALGNSGVTMGG